MLYKSRLPLYEGVDWNSVISPLSDFTSNVSLFTREWIEITRSRSAAHCSEVSLFTREWIEMATAFMIFSGFFRLPLYEGVDWNSPKKKHPPRAWVSLFTREWIEIAIGQSIGYALDSLPLYEGVDWNCCGVYNWDCQWGLPLYEGVDWNYRCSVSRPSTESVSLFTREWIEIMNPLLLVAMNRSPSLRGSGLKSLNRYIYEESLDKSPSLRGSGLKFFCGCGVCSVKQSPSLRGSGLKSTAYVGKPADCASPSLRGSGLKYLFSIISLLASGVSLFTREWIEIA